MSGSRAADHRSERPGVLLRLTHWIGRAVVPFAMLANIGCYIGTLTLLDQARAQHTAQLEDWRVVTVLLLLCWQASWLHFLQRQALGTFLGSLALWWGALLLGGFGALALQPGVLLATFSFAAERAGALRATVVAFAITCTAAVFVAADAFYAPAGTPHWDTPAVLVTWAASAVGIVGAPAVLGAWYAQLRDRAERIAALALEVTSGEAVRTAEAVCAERRTLAQELHDTSSAHLAALLALTTAAQSTAAPSTAETADTVHMRLIRQIRDEGEKLYQGFERMLTRMRQEDRTATDGHHPGHGQHTVAEVADLTDMHRDSTGVDLVLRHEPALAEIDQRLGPMRSHIAYRAVQEALSNARKHAPGATITITLEDDGTSLLLRVENGPAHDSPAARVSAVQPLSLGYGLEGMRDRLVAAGGSLRTGPRHAGGWAVHALLPHPPHRATREEEI